MATWITDRTKDDVARVAEIFQKAKAGEWNDSEKTEWNFGMKGALSYLDYNRIEAGIDELAKIVGVEVSVKMDWSPTGYLTTADSERWLSNISSIRSKCSGPFGLSETPSSMEMLTFETMNTIETILSFVENTAKDKLVYCSEPICGGEPYYGIC